MHDHVLLRRAGFPFALVEPKPGTVDAAAADRAEHLVDAWRQLERAAGRLLRDEIHREVDRTRAAGRDRTRLRRLSTLRTDLGHRRWPRAARSARALVGDDGDFGRAAADYVQRHEAVRRAETDLLADQSDVLASERERILAALERPDVRDALVQLSPSFAEQARRVAERGRDGPPRARDRRFTRTAYLFLQRLAAKNETTGFFGPLTHGVVEGDRTGIGFGPETATGHRRRRAFLSFWAVAELARSIAADPVFAEHLLVRRSPLIGLADAGIVLPDGRVVDLDTADIAILDGLSAPTTVAALVGSLGAVGSAPVVRRRLDRLVRAGVLLADLEPSSTRPQPLTELRARIRTVDGGDTWRAALRDVADRVRDYGDATSAETRLDALGAVERRFEELTSRPARRDGGRMYADRLVVFEECEGDAPVSVGGDVVRRWSDQLGPYLDLCAAYGELRWRGLRTLVTELVTEPCGFLSFAERLAAAIEAGGLNRHREAERPLLDAYTAVVERAEQDGVALLRPEDLAELVDASGAARTRPRFVSPDLMPA
ncbi:lantibiotic dehydratase, partial [Actinosynnema sp. NPDC059797]